MSPILIDRYDSEGRAVLKYKDNIKELTNAYNELIIANNNKLLGKSGNIFENFKNEMDDITRTKDSGNDRLKVDSANTRVITYDIKISGQVVETIELTFTTN